MIHTKEVVIVVGAAMIRPVSVAQMPNDALLAWRQMPDQQATCDVRTRTTCAAQRNLKLKQFTDRPQYFPTTLARKAINLVVSVCMSVRPFVPTGNFRKWIPPSVLWRCWLGVRKGIRPVKNWVVGCWRGYLSGARCRLAYGPADSTATPCLLLQ